MDVELNPKRGLGCVVTVLSLGLVPIVQRRQERQYPQSLSETGLRLRNGQEIAWTSVKRFKATEFRMGRGRLALKYDLWHEGGRITFLAHHILNAEAVVGYILSHLPEGTPMR